MAAKKRQSKMDAGWAEAKRRCRLSDDEVRMAKELGFAPSSLIKNIPNPAQLWKLPVNLWIREQYAKKQPRMAQPPALEKVALPMAQPIPDDDNPLTDDSPLEEPAFDEDTMPNLLDETRPWWDDGPLDDRRIAEQDAAMLKRQRDFRTVAEHVSKAFTEFAWVQRVVLFGSVAVPLEKEVPRFSEFRRAGIAVWHECKDVDLAVWVTDLTNLRAMSKARARVCNELGRGNIGVAHHSVDVFLMEPGSNRYLGRLCLFNECPKPNKQECTVPGCGASLFLQQHAKFKLRADALNADRSVLLFDRTPSI